MAKWQGVGAYVLVSVLLWGQHQDADARPLVLTVQDENGKPIEGAFVTFFSDTSTICTTDAQGSCARETELPHLDVAIERTGYLPIKSRFNFADPDGLVKVTMYSVAHEQAFLARQAKEADVTQKRAQKEEALRTSMRASLVQMTNDVDLCAIAGHMFRGGSPVDFLPFFESDRENLLKEFARRKLSFNRAQAKEESLVRGMSECSMAASFGKPSKRNRSVGPWGVRVQYVYDNLGMYVYTRNGRVDSWQD